MGRKLQTLTVFLSSDPTKFERGLRRAKRSLAGFAKFAAGGVLVAGAAAGAAGAGLVATSVRSFVDAQETFSKFETVFSNVGIMAEAAAKDIAKNYGLSTVATKDLLSANADILSGFGFTQEKALDLSSSVLKLGADLASFANFKGGTAGATTALTKALLGETESAKALGIVIRQDSEEFKTLVEQGQKAKGLTLLQAKAMAALTIATKQSKNAVGDFARTADSPSNRLRVLKARWTDIKVVLGEIAFKSLDLGKGIGGLTDGLSKFAEDLSKNSVEWIRTLRLFVNEVITSVKKTFAWVEALFTIDSQTAKQKQLLVEWDANYMQRLNEDKTLTDTQRKAKFANRWDERNQFRKSIGDTGSWNQLMGKLDKYNEEYTQNKTNINEAAKEQKSSLQRFAKTVENATKRIANQKNKPSLADNTQNTALNNEKAATGRKSEAILKGSLLDYQTDIYSKRPQSSPESQTASHTKQMAETLNSVFNTVKDIKNRINKAFGNFTLSSLLGI